MKKYYACEKNYYTHWRPHIFFQICRGLVFIFYPAYKTVWMTSNQESEAIYVANHSKIHGPLYAMLDFPKKMRIWGDGPLCFLNQAHDYIMENFFPTHLKKQYHFYSFLAYILAPMMVAIFKGAEIIPVFRGPDLLITFRKTVETLKEGKNIFLFAECPTRYNKYINEFNRGFVQVGRVINSLMKKRIPFYPVYVCASLKTTLIGEPIYYNPELKPDEQTEAICKYLQDEITKMALTLPDHKVVNF